MNKFIIIRMASAGIFLGGILTLSHGETPEQVAAMIESHQYREAKVALQAELKANPQSARAWYYLAQDDYFLRDFAGGKQALDRAKNLDPNLTFTNRPEKVAQLESDLTNRPALSGSTGYASEQAALPQRSENNFSFLPILLLVGGGLFVAFLIFRLIRSNSYGAYSSPYAPGSNPAAPAPPPVYPYPSSGSGLGSFVGGMAAGAVLDELIRPREEVIRETEIVRDDRPVANDPPSSDYTFDPGTSSSNDSFDSGNSSPDNNSGW